MELIVYMALMTSFLGTMVGADQLARKLYRRDSAEIAGLTSLDRLFRGLEEGFDTRPAARVLPDGVAFEGGRSFRFRATDHAVFRDDALFVGQVERFEVTQDPRHPALFRVMVRTRGPRLARGETDRPKRRVFRRSFLLQNLGGGESRGGF